MKELEQEWIDKLHELYRGDGEFSLKYAHSEGFCVYFTDVKDKSKKFPGIAYAKFNDPEFTYTVMSVMGDTLDVPADVFRSIWITKDDQWENAEPIVFNSDRPPITMDPCRPAHELPDYEAGIQKVGDMLSVYGFRMAMPDRIILEYGNDPDIDGRRITIIGDNITIDDSRIEFHTNSIPAPTNVEEDSEKRYYAE